MTASFVVTKSEVFWTKHSNFFEDIIREFDLREMDDEGKRNVVFVEIYPDDRDLLRPLDEWIYRLGLDQEPLPEWYDKKDVESRCREALNDWKKAKIITSGHHKIADGCVYVYGKATVTASGKARVDHFGKATVEAGGESTVRVHTTALVRASSSSTVIALNFSIVEALHNSTVYAFDKSIVIKGRKSQATVTLHQDAVCIDRSGSTVKVEIAQ